MSAYVANLAAFLTRTTPVNVANMADVIANGLKVCVHRTLKDELQNKWPRANFVFSDTKSSSYYGLVDDYKAGKCDVLAMGQVFAKSDFEFMDTICETGLVLTDSEVIVNPVGFPIQPELGMQSSFTCASWHVTFYFIDIF